METVPLSIPYFVLSTQQHRDGTRQVHVLTPFGCIDICVKLIDGREPRPLVDVSVQGDLGPWVLDRRMPNAFRDALFQLVGGIALSRNGCCVRRRCRLMIHYQSTDGRLSMTGYLPPSSEVALRADTPEPPNPPYYQWHHDAGKTAAPTPVGAAAAALIPGASATGGG